MLGLQAENHEVTDEDHLQTAEQYVLHLMHLAAYLHAARVVDAKSVLDLGCNAGYGTRILSDHARDAAGIDVSPRAIAFARNKYHDTSIQFQVTDGVRIGFEDSSFDAITCFQIIEHLVEYDAFMNELKRVLTPTGLVMFTTPNSLLRLDPGMKPWNPFHVREFDAEQLRSVLENYFANVSVLALYATPPLHKMIADRADRIRRSARAKASGAQSKTPPGAVPQPDRQVAGTADSKASAPSIRSVTADYRADDFHYREGGLDACLEFIALCSDGDISGYIASVADQRNS